MGIYLSALKNRWLPTMVRMTGFATHAVHLNLDKSTSFFGVYDGHGGIWTYGAFLSYGEDTRNSFVGHIYSALQRKSIPTFKGEKRLDDIEELLKAIEQSRISFVIFSKNYPDSPSRLDELAKISEGISKPGYYVVPIFIDVCPSEVREQSGKYKEFFDKHEKDLSDDIGRVQRWRLALTLIASLVGFDVRAKSESDVIDEIVADAISKLNEGLSLGDYLVRMQSSAGTCDEEVWRILEEHFVGLGEKVKDLFVEVACFFKGADVNYVTEILEHCGFNPKNGIRVLSDRSLLKIDNGRLWMNDILQELGWKIAKGKFPNEPAKWSRLWSNKDIETVETGTENVEAIVLSLDPPQGSPKLKAEALSQMSHLRLIIFPDNVEISGNLNSLSNELRLLSWRKFPFSSLPSSFEPDKLVELVMRDSNIEQLWEGEKRLPNLRGIDLRGSPRLTETPNVRGVANLERLDLEGCSKLWQVHPSVGELERITYLNFKDCPNLTSIPNALFRSTSLEILNLSGCGGLGKGPNSNGA